MSYPGVELFQTSAKGRGLKATRKFETGQAVLKQEPYAYAVMSSHIDVVCHYCLCAPGQPGAPVEDLHRCTGCKFAQYCTKECQKKAWPEHKQECAAIKRITPGKPVDQTRLVGRILWRRKREENLNGEKKDGKENDEKKVELVKIEELEDHLSKRNAEEKEAIDEKVYSFGDYFTYDEMPDSDEEMAHLFAIIDCNAIGLNDHRGVQTIGVGIYPGISMLNHDCSPNCVAMNNGPRLEVRALRVIQPGEELCISYIDSLETTEKRREKLKLQYYFDCECDTCTKGEELENLKHALVSEDIKEESVKYINQFSKDMLKRIHKTKQNQNWERMCNQTLGTLAQQDCVIADTNVLKIAMLNHAVEVQSFLRRQEPALEYAERVAAAYEKLLPPVHPTLGMYLMRLGVIQWQIQKTEAAVATLGRAASIISKTHGDDHGMFKELLGLIHQCKMEAHMSKGAQREFRMAKKKAGLKLPA
uniref:[histone H3]-lysine(4) N-trimethyltransferase n=1 Tax=Ciona intestinalis TaxID=7719 RepID=Q4H2S8_CIOIN|nr:SET and MYND domain containing protein [Ciona intestinalis]BAE06699.1 SET and MYND domain containing protein [Ciona intestinalis]|eukprot:NP_001071820.1 SET and MYND domain containing protein [Ciona intestinalis]